VKDVPVEQRTIKMYESCARTRQFHEIPVAVLTMRMCMDYLHGGDATMNDIPAMFKTRELCEYAVKGDIRRILDIPEEFVTREMLEQYQERMFHAAQSHETRNKLLKLKAKFAAPLSHARSSPPRKSSPPPAQKANSSPPRKSSPQRSSWVQMARR
jgi:hypothetical protein